MFEFLRHKQYQVDDFVINSTPMKLKACDLIDPEVIRSQYPTLWKPKEDGVIPDVFSQESKETNKGPHELVEERRKIVYDRFEIWRTVNRLNQCIPLLDIPRDFAAEHISLLRERTDLFRQRCNIQKQIESIKEKNKKRKKECDRLYEVQESLFAELDALRKSSDSSGKKEAKERILYARKMWEKAYEEYEELFTDVYARREAQKEAWQDIHRRLGEMLLEYRHASRSMEPGKRGGLRGRLFGVAIERNDWMDAANTMVPSQLCCITNQLTSLIHEQIRGLGWCHSMWRTQAGLLYQLGYRYYLQSEIVPGILYD